MRRPSPALVVAVLALIVAMSGTSYAVTQLPRNSVGAKQIKKNAVTSAKIKDGTIATADLAVATRDALKGQRGETGPQGPAGPAGPTAGASVAVLVGTDVSTSLDPLVSLGAAESTSVRASSGPIVVGTRSRLQISATVNLEKFVTGSSASDARVICYAQWAVAGSGTWQDTAGVSMGSVTLRTEALPSGTNAWGTLSVEALQVVDPGAYDVRLVCVRQGPAVAADYAGINVVAIPAS